MKIVWTSNFHGQPTGYGTICKNVVPHIQNNSRHEMIEFAISGINRVMPSTWRGVKVYGASNFGGKFGQGDWATVHNLEHPDMWLLNFDAWAADASIPKIGMKYVVYPPVDHDPLPPVWVDCLRGAADIVPYCEFGARVIREGLGITTPISPYIPHGVDTNAFRPMDVVKSEVFGRETDDDAFVIGIYKNNQGTRAQYPVQLEGIRLFLNTVKDDNVRIYIHANATGQQAPDIRELVRRYNLGGHVYLIAPDRYRYGISDDELAQTYNACDVLLNCVAGEGWGLPITEAFACGTPVIGLAFTSMPELISGVEGEIKKEILTNGECYEVNRGWLVPTAGNEYTLGKRSERRRIDPADIATALVKAYEDPGKRKAMGERAREWVQPYDWKLVGDMWIDYMDRMQKKILPKKYSWKPLETGPVGKNKTACVVFSFNRTDYLVQTLASLLGNTKANECDWFFYQDGWKSNPRYPYATEEDEVKVREQVQQCIEVLEGFPFLNKEIITKEYNVCIGAQLQEAKKRLFKEYDNVIFFDDDHIMSPDYIDVLLKLHEQYPDAIVGAQATEIRNIPKDATLDAVGVVTKALGDAHAFPGRWRWLGYLMPKVVHEATVDGMDEYLEFIGSSYRNIPNNAVRIKYGVAVTGFDGVLDKLCNDLEIQRVSTVVPRARYIGKTGMFGTPEIFATMGFPSWDKFQFDESEISEFHDYVDRAEEVTKAHGHTIKPNAMDRLEGPDKFVTDVIKASVKEGDTVVDVGACVGYYTILMSDLVGPNGKVWAFEPDPTNFAVLKQNVGDRENVTLVNAAVADKSGEGKLYLSKVNLGDHRLFPSYEDQGSAIVDVVALDRYFGGEVEVSTHGVEEVKTIQTVGLQAGFIKLDAQGAEFAVLVGAKRVLANSPNAQMVVEYSPKMLEEYGSNGAEFLQWLQDHGFSLKAVRSHDLPLTFDQVLEAYPTDKEDFTDLWLVKGSI